MTSTSRPTPTDRDDRIADPWWGLDEPAGAPMVDDVLAPTAQARRRSQTSAARSPRRQRGLPARIRWLLLGLVVVPIDATRRVLARSPRLRRLATRLAVIVAILLVLACSVGVILINNFVIGRTAELGELDDRRSELRRENAVLGAQVAKLSAPDVVFRRATRELGMVPTDDVPQFIFLVPGSRTLTPLQRRRVAARVRLQQERQQAATARTQEAAE